MHKNVTTYNGSGKDRYAKKTQFEEVLFSFHILHFTTWQIKTC